MIQAHDIEFRFNGRRVLAGPGQSVAAALHANGIAALTVSSKYHRPRGIFCAAGHCPNCLLNVDGRPNTRSCTVDAERGMDVRSELSRARASVLRGIDLTGPLFPLGFQYRYFKRPQWAYRIWEQQLRRTASHTRLPTIIAAGPPARRATAEVAIVGAGPAGLGAAVAVAEAGLRVALVSRRKGLGGGAKPLAAQSLLGQAAARLESADNVEVLKEATVVAQFGSVLVVDGRREAIQLEAEESILASGCYERLLPFDGNDLPGVMLAGAARRLLLEQNTRPGRRVAIVTNNDWPYSLVGQLLAAGIEVAAILDLRPAAQLQRPRARLNVRIEPGATIVGARGWQRVRWLRARSSNGQRLNVRCDAILLSGGWQPADELRRAATGRGGIVVESDGAEPVDWQSAAAATSPLLQGAGSVVGVSSALEAYRQGQIAGLQAARRHGRDVRSALEHARSELRAATTDGAG
jgi:NADPH-dependent 2,4-dienoyl-CoA reductase/sulfur reductase-like enzyme